MADILVVDESRNTCKALEVLLSREGYTVLTATSGEAALTCLETQEIGLVLCAVKLPKMDGLTLLQHVRSRAPGVAVIMMYHPGHHDIAVAVEAIKAGAFDCLIKPLSKENVLQGIQKALAMRALLVEKRPRVFISYVRENSEDVWQLVKALKAHGIDMWFDQTHLEPGDRWKDVIRREIAAGDFFIACFSVESTQRPRSFMNEELAQAIEQMRQLAHDRRWFIPILLSSYEVPDISVSPGVTLRSFQWVALYEDWDAGIRRLLSVIEPSGTATRRAEIQDDSTTMAALRALSERLLAQLRTLPFPELNDRAIRNAVLWQDQDLQRLETLTESTEAATMSLVSRLIMHLRFIKTRIEEVQSVDPRIGYNYNRLFPFEQWTDSFQQAQTALQTLVGTGGDAAVTATNQ